MLGVGLQARGEGGGRVLRAGRRLQPRYLPARIRCVDPHLDAAHRAATAAGALHAARQPPGWTHSGTCMHGAACTASCCTGAPRACMHACMSFPPQRRQSAIRRRAASQLAALLAGGQSPLCPPQLSSQSNHMLTYTAAHCACCIPSGRMHALIPSHPSAHASASAHRGVARRRGQQLEAVARHARRAGDAGRALAHGGRHLEGRGLPAAKHGHTRRLGWGVRAAEPGTACQATE